MHWKLRYDEELELYALTYDGGLVAMSESPSLLICCQPSFRAEVMA